VKASVLAIGAPCGTLPPGAKAQLSVPVSTGHASATRVRRGRYLLRRTRACTAHIAASLK